MRPTAADAPAPLSRGFAPNHKLRRAVTTLAIGNIGKRCEAGAGGHAGKVDATGYCDTQAKPRVQGHDDRDTFQASPQELPAIDIHSL